MPMLAENRRKQKLSIDPRGLNWAKDDNKIGQQLMERMGWKKGEGLGAAGDGCTEHISVQYKDDNRGVGCSKKNADDWIAHQDDFNSLLSTLNASTPSTSIETRVQQLHTKSQESKGRLHYHKFARGKDLSTAKDEDLNCILGKRSVLLPQTSESSTEQVEERTSNLHGITTVSSEMSISEYFAQKIAEKKKNLCSSNPALINNDYERMEGPKDNRSEKDTFDDYVENGGKCTSFYGSAENQLPNDDSYTRKSKCKKKKDKRMKKEAEEMCSGELAIMGKAKKKAKEETNDSNEECSVTLACSENITDDYSPYDKCRRKRKKKNKEKECDSISDEEDLQVEVNMKKSKRNKKEKNLDVCSRSEHVDKSAICKDKKEPKETVSDVIEYDYNAMDTDESINKSKRKKNKKRKKESNSDGNDLENTVDVGEVLDNVDNSHCKNKYKPKKDKKRKKAKNTDINEVDIAIVEQEGIGDVDKKKNSKHIIDKICKMEETGECEKSAFVQEEIPNDQEFSADESSLKKKRKFQNASVENSSKSITKEKEKSKSGRKESESMGDDINSVNKQEFINSSELCASDTKNYIIYGDFVKGDTTMKTSSLRNTIYYPQETSNRYSDFSGSIARSLVENEMALANRSSRNCTRLSQKLAKCSMIETFIGADFEFVRGYGNGRDMGYTRKLMSWEQI